MAKDLLDETTVVAYLINRGIINGPAEVEELTGGVSNVVLAVKSGDKDLVLKQALPQLKVAAVWSKWHETSSFNYPRERSRFS